MKRKGSTTQFRTGYIDRGASGEKHMNYNLKKTPNHLIAEIIQTLVNSKRFEFNVAIL